MDVGEEPLQAFCFFRCYTHQLRRLLTSVTAFFTPKPLAVNRVAERAHGLQEFSAAGATHKGRHEPLIEEGVFDKVQQILAAQRQSGERSWRHHHYLRGSLVCADCGRRLFFVRPRGRSTTYEYFVCGGRSARLCPQPYHRVEAIEQAVERHYVTLHLTDQQRARIRTAVRTHLDGLAAAADKETARARAEVIRLDNEERKLLTAHYADRISDHIYAEEQKRIRRERVAADQLLQRFQINHQDILETVDHALALTDNIQTAYLKADDTERRLLNQAFFEYLEIDNEEVAQHELAAPFAQLTPITTNSAPNARTPDPLKKVEGSYVQDLVEPAGLEPATSCMPCKRSPS
jgi:site-specific DNA recombinase